MTDLSIIIVSYKENLDVLKACLDSVRASKGVDSELIVVDNANNPAVKGLLNAYERSVYIGNSTNSGFASAVNIGMRQAKGQYILLLNPDTEFESNVLARMVGHLRNEHNIGVASCIIRYPNGELQESIRRFPTVWNHLVIMLKMPHILGEKVISRYMMRDVDPLETQDVDSIMGAFMFITREAINRIGLFDERYFIWFEEVDYCKMVKDAGLRVVHFADVEITHHKGHSFSKVATLRKQKWMRTSFRKYARKHFGFLPWMFLWFVAPLLVTVGYVTAVIKPR